MSTEVPEFTKKLPSPPLVVQVVVAVFAFIAFLAFPNATPNGTLDSSWSAAIASFFGTSVQAGKDYIFTYGPLGFLLSAFFDPGTFAGKWLFEVLLKGYIVIEILRLGRLPQPDGTVLPGWRPLLPLLIPGIAWMFSIYPGGVYSTDAWAYVVLIVLATAPVLDRNFGIGRVIATVVIVAVLSLAKATLTALALPVIVICALRVLHREQKSPVWQSPLLLFPTVWLGLWLALRQNPGNVLSFFLGSLSVATGYNEAMAFATPVYRNSPVPLVAMILCVFLLLAAVRFQNDGLSKNKSESALKTIYLCFLALLTLLAYKHGITRGGNHTLIPFLTFTFFSTFMLGVLPAGPKPLPRNIALILSVCCSFFGVIRGDDGWFHRDTNYPPFVSAFTPLFNPIGFWHTQTNNMQHDDGVLTFPETKKIVGTAPIGMWSYEQGLLLLNHLNYRPQPTFQGYNAYTRYLQEKDLAFWKSEDAPPFLLFAQKSIDFRYPTLDGGRAFVAMLNRYKPILVENGYVLLKRQENTESSNSDTQGERDTKPIVIAHDKWISLPPSVPGTIQMVAVSIKPTPAGITRRLLFKPADVLLATRNVGSEDATIHRLPPNMAEQGFLLNPYLPNTQSVVVLYSGQPVPSQVEQFAIVYPPDSVPCFQPDVEIRLYNLPFGTTAP